MTIHRLFFAPRPIGPTVAARLLLVGLALVPWLDMRVAAQESKPTARSAKTPAGDVDLESIRAQLRAAVAAGKLTVAQASEKWRALLWAEPRKASVDPSALGRELKAAVRAGKLTEAEALAKWEAHVAAGEKSGVRNAVCPVTGEPVDEDSPTSRYDGRTVAFCCRKCKAKFDADPSAFASKLASAKRPARAARGAGAFLPIDPDAEPVDAAALDGLSTPAAAATREGAAHTLIFGWAANATHRFMDASHKGHARTIHGVSFRLDQRDHAAVGRTWENVTVRVAHGEWSSIRYNESEEYELVDKPVVVFDKAWSFPAVHGRPALTPASWGGLQGSLTLRFNEAFEYDGKHAIFLEFVFRGGKAHDGREWRGQTPRGFEYYLDSMPERGGWRARRGGRVTSVGVRARPELVPAATSYAAGSHPTEMSVWTAAAKGMPFIHYLTR